MRCCLEEIGEDLRGEGGGGGGDLTVDEDQGEEGFIDIGIHLAWFAVATIGYPVWCCDAGMDDPLKRLGRRFGIGLEKAVVDCIQHVADFFGLVGQCHGESVLELADKARDDLRPQDLEIAEGQEHAGALFQTSQYERGYISTK